MIKKLIFILFICFASISLAQNEIKIAFGDKINLGKVHQGTIFEIKSSRNNFKVFGEEINNFVFEQPDRYNIRIIAVIRHNEVDCSHNVLPENIVVNVSDCKIAFDPKSIRFSKKIQKNIATDGIYLTIDVTTYSYNHKKVKMDLSTVNTAGIGSEITAKLNKKFEMLNEGKQAIEYKISGIVTENSFLMFDFINPNGTFQSIALLQAIEN